MISIYNATYDANGYKHKCFTHGYPLSEDLIIDYEKCFE